jgi:hypothetical protein
MKIDIGSFCASDFGSNCATLVRDGTYNVSICATLKDQVDTLSLKKTSDMANILDPMDLKQISSLHLDGFSNRKIGTTLGISRNTVNTYIRSFKASEYSFKELLAFDNAGLEVLFPSHTTVDNERYNELMLYFEGVNKAGIIPDLPSCTITRSMCKRLSTLMAIRSSWNTAGASMQRSRAP